MYCRIGYPLGLKTENKENPIMLIELQDKIVELTRDEFFAWTSWGLEELFQEIETSKENVKDLLSELDTFLETIKTPTMEKTLINKGVLIKVDRETISKLYNYNIVRQGFGSGADFRYCIVVGKVPYFLTEVQIQIWRNANGKHNLIDIYNNHAVRFKIDFFTFVRNIVSLQENNLIAII
jgi:hypothetical protein